MTLAAAAIAEGDMHLMGTLLVFVHQHQGPLAIGAEHRVRCNENMSGGVADVTRARENAVLTAPRLNPLEIDHLTRKKLRRGLLDFVFLVHRE